MRILSGALICLFLAGCNDQSLTPQQRVLLTDLEAIGVRAACLKIEQQYAKVGKPTAIQESLMGNVRMVCWDPYASIQTFKDRAALLIAALPAKS